MQAKAKERTKLQGGQKKKIDGIRSEKDELRGFLVLLWLFLWRCFFFPFGILTPSLVRRAESKFQLASGLNVEETANENKGTFQQSSKVWQG
jgi:hypothetical protein